MYVNKRLDNIKR